MIKIMRMGEVPASEIFSRVTVENDIADIVRDIITGVQKDGDKALLRYTEKFDHVQLDSLAVPDEDIQEALRTVDPAFLKVLNRSAENIRAYHSRQVRSSFVLTEKEGVVMGQKIQPLDRVGIYIPGGTAPLSSTVLMNAIPAKIAGCPEICMVTPPGRDGKIAPSILAAAAVAGVSRIFRVGGAQAIAALAYGTESIPRVDKIVGPGNAFVAEAKKQVFGSVAIDMIAGPSEILVISDSESNPAYLAADLLSQAEHDRMASAVLVTDSPELAKNVANEIERQLPLLDRENIARYSIDHNGKIIICEDLNAAVEVSNQIAPEHLELCVADPFAMLASVRHAGSVFMGRYCPEALGDYLAGPNHTLPTSGTARFSSPLSVDDFIKKTQFTYYTREAISSCADDIAVFARMEGLEAHARSALSRKEV